MNHSNESLNPLQAVHLAIFDVCARASSSVLPYFHSHRSASLLLKTQADHAHQVAFFVSDFRSLQLSSRDTCFNFNWLRDLMMRFHADEEFLEAIAMARRVVSWLVAIESYCSPEAHLRVCRAALLKNFFPLHLIDI